MDDILKCFFFIFQRKQVLIFYVNCLPSRRFTWYIKTSFLWKIKKKIFQNVVCCSCDWRFKVKILGMVRNWGFLKFPVSRVFYMAADKVTHWCDNGTCFCYLLYISFSRQNMYSRYILELLHRGESLSIQNIFILFIYLFIYLFFFFCEIYPNVATDFPYPLYPEF